MPQRNYSEGELVYIYDTTHFRFGTVLNWRSWRDEDGLRHESYAVTTLNRADIVTCAPDQLRAACWTFVGPLIVPGDDVIKGFGEKVSPQERRHRPGAVHWFSNKDSVRRLRMWNIK